MVNFAQVKQNLKSLRGILVCKLSHEERKRKSQNWVDTQVRL